MTDITASSLSQSSLSKGSVAQPANNKTTSVTVSPKSSLMKGDKSYFAQRLTQHLQMIAMSKYRLSKLSGALESAIINVTNGKRRPTDDLIRKLANVPQLRLSYDTLRAWRALDEWTPNELLLAVREMALVNADHADNLTHLRQGIRKAIFLDRDGTLNEERGYLHSLNDLVLMPGTANALKALKAAGYALILTTNQSGPARGYYDEAHVQALNNRLLDLLYEEAQVELDATYYCPHLPDGVVDSYTVNCSCRKPEIGMIQNAMELFPAIALKDSWVIGDKASDIEFAHNAGCKSILLLSGYGQQVVDGQYQSLQTPPTHICPTIQEAAELILKTQ